MNKKENAALFSAIARNNSDEVARLLSVHPGSVDVYGVSNRNCRDKTPLMYAMQCGHFGLVYWLLDRGASVTARMAGGPKSTVIQLAALFGHPGSPHYESFLDLTQELIRRGANPTDALSTAVFHYHTFGERPERMIELLLRHGADSTIRIGDFTLWEHAERVGDVRFPKVVRDLLRVSESRADMERR